MIVVKIRGIERLTTIWKYAQSLCKGGKSQIRKDRDDRLDNLMIDQLCGVSGNYALCWWKDGNDATFKDLMYYQSRFQERGEYGDGGHDIPRCKIDIKSSIMRVDGRRPYEYNLIVSKKEWRDNWVYVLGLMHDFGDSEDFLKLDELDCLLMGWKHSSELVIQESGKFAGNYVCPAKDLHPMMPLEYLK